MVHLQCSQTSRLESSFLVVVHLGPHDRPGHWHWMLDLSHAAQTTEVHMVETPA